MTTREAITYLKTLYDKEHPERNEALDVAIADLRSASFECVSKDDVIEEIEWWKSHNPKSEELLNDILESVKSLPLVTTKSTRETLEKIWEELNVAKTWDEAIAIVGRFIS